MRQRTGAGNAPQLVVKTEDVRAEHIELYATLSRAEYGDAAIADPAHLRWKFLRNPQGASRAVHVFRADALVARLVAQPRLFHTPSGQVTGAYMVDMVVHPEHRGMPTLLALMAGFRQLQAGFAFVFVTPNAAGAVVWKSLAKLPQPFTLDVKVVPLRPGALAQRRFARVPRAAGVVADAVVRAVGATVARAAGADARLRLDRRWPSDEELDRLLDHPFAGRLVGVRDRRFLAWRFAESPRFAYDLDFIYKNDVLAGYLATRRLVYEGYDTRFVIDAHGAAALTPSDWRRIAWRTIGVELDGAGPQVLMVLANTQLGPLAEFCALPFVRVPERFLPQRPSVFAQWWSPPAGALTREGWELSLADCDMI